MKSMEIKKIKEAEDANSRQEKEERWFNIDLSLECFLYDLHIIIQL